MVCYTPIVTDKLIEKLINKKSEEIIMKKAIDVNKRTLEQEKQNLKKTCNIVRIEAVCFGFALLMAFIKNAIEFDKVYSSEICSIISIISIP